MSNLRSYRQAILDFNDWDLILVAALAARDTFYCDFYHQDTFETYLKSWNERKHRFILSRENASKWKAFLLHYFFHKRDIINKSFKILKLNSKNWKFSNEHIVVWEGVDFIKELFFEILALKTIRFKWNYRSFEYSESKWSEDYYLTFYNKANHEWGKQKKYLLPMMFESHFGFEVDSKLILRLDRWDYRLKFLQNEPKVIVKEFPKKEGRYQLVFYSKNRDLVVDSQKLLSEYINQQSNVTYKSWLLVNMKTEHFFKESSSFYYREVINKKNWIPLYSAWGSQHSLFHWHQESILENLMKIVRDVEEKHVEPHKWSLLSQRDWLRNHKMENEALRAPKSLKMSYYKWARNWAHR